MARADLVADLRASLHDAAGLFEAPDDEAFGRLLDVAVEAFAPLVPRTLVGSLALVADQPNYAPPADLWRFKLSTWGAVRAQPWERSWPGRMPEVREAEGELWLTPPPSAHQIAVLGSTYTFFYYAHHAIGADAAQTTIPAGDRGLLMLRAQAEAMRELAMRDAVRPATVRDGVSGQPRNGTTAGLAETFMREFERQAALRRAA